MTATGDGDDDSEVAFVLLMLVISVLVFLAIRDDERSGPGSARERDTPQGDDDSGRPETS